MCGYLFGREFYSHRTPMLWKRSSVFKHVCYFFPSRLVEHSCVSHQHVGLKALYGGSVGCWMSTLRPVRPRNAPGAAVVAPLRAGRERVIRQGQAHVSVNRKI